MPISRVLWYKVQVLEVQVFEVQNLNWLQNMSERLRGKLLILTFVTSNVLPRSKTLNGRTTTLASRPRMASETTFILPFTRERRSLHPQPHLKWTFRRPLRPHCRMQNSSLAIGLVLLSSYAHPPNKWSPSKLSKWLASLWRKAGQQDSLFYECFEYYGQASRADKENGTRYSFFPVPLFCEAHTRSTEELAQDL